MYKKERGERERHDKYAVKYNNKAGPDTSKNIKTLQEIKRVSLFEQRSYLETGKVPGRGTQKKISSTVYVRLQIN